MTPTRSQVTSRLTTLVLAAAAVVALLLAIVGPVLAVPAPKLAPTAPGSLQLDGVSAYIEVPYAVDLNTLDAMTLEAWVKRTDATRCETLVGNGWQTSYWLGLCSAPVRFYGGGGLFADGTATIPAGTWTHIAVTFDGNTRRYYVDGQLDSETTAAAGPILGSKDLPLYLGADRDGGYYFKGPMDEVRFWGIARTQQEIQADLYNDVSSVAGLLAVWHFDGDALDSAGKHDGVLMGQATFNNEGHPNAPAMGSAPDLGDAPDSTNSVGKPMEAYAGVTADFPRCSTQARRPTARSTRMIRCVSTSAERSAWRMRRMQARMRMVSTILIRAPTRPTRTARMMASSSRSVSPTVSSPRSAYKSMHWRVRRRTFT